MSTTDASATNSEIVCVSCQQANSAQTKFCSSCGHGLYEACGDCGKPVALDQKFCGTCGTDLMAIVSKRRAQYEGWLSGAIGKVKSHEYDEALSLLKRITEQTDVRYKDLVENAVKAIDKIESIAEKNRGGASARIEQAGQAFQENDHQRVIECLGEIPESMMTEEARGWLGKSRHHLKQFASLKGELSACIEQRDWPTAGHILEQLLELAPGDAKFTKLSKQVAAKLLKSAIKRLDRHDYDRAADRLHAIPESCRDEGYDAIVQRAGNLSWLAAQFSPEPFATSTLGRLAVRYAKEAPGNGGAGDTVKELATRIKQRPKDPRIALPRYKASPESWLGGEAELFSVPRSIDCGDTPAFRERPGRFAVAIGLALQGLGQGRISDHMANKTGLLKSLALRGRTTCWGVDVGTSSIHAVLLRQSKTDDRPVAVKTYHADLDEPVGRVGNESREPLILKAAVEKMIAETEMGEDEVLANFSSSQTVSRFVTLPPVKDKALSKLIEQEIPQQIPIPQQDLELVVWSAPLKSGDSMGRPTVIVAAKKGLVERRADWMRDAGLNLIGLQSETLALVNFANFEFADLLEPETEADQADAKSPSVALVDAGATSTRLVVVASGRCWFWTIDSGGEEMTSVLARITRKTKPDAELLKLNPAALPDPKNQFEPLEEKMASLRGRLSKIASDGFGTEDAFRVEQTWCFGGVPLTHGWIRRVLLKSEPS